MIDGPNQAGSATGRVLVVDDELAVLRAYERMLVSAGYVVAIATDGLKARALFDADRFDVIVSDIAMPGLDGLGLLRAVRGRDLDVPVVLVTGEPTAETASRAVEYGAFGYLKKPVAARALLDVIAHAVRLHELARLKRRALEAIGDGSHQVGDLAGLETAFDRALSSLWMAFQPIVDWRTKELHGYEALMRSKEPLLPHPGAVLDAAERLRRVHELGRTTRERVAAVIPSFPADARCFVNLHPSDLIDDQLYAPSAPLTQFAGRVVLELTERAALDGVDDPPRRVAELRRLGYRIAIDDLGAGYAGLTAFAELRPDVVKLDATLVRNVDAEVVKRKIVGSMIAVCREMNLSIVCEGVETADERDALAQLGADLLQGYLFARPGKPFPAIVW
ncbi:MAG TPA: EAL domain-containing protein [Byssovorax sp.]|jgi:EAL domain-containing protein (putative c-di-GMP-specific phosphodiesterase class I)